MTPPGPDDSKGSWVGYAAAAWSLIFAVLHIVWASGWYIGLQEEQARQAFQKTWFLVYDLVVVGMCAVAVAVTLATVQPWGRRIPRWLLGPLVWIGTGLLVLRAGAAAVQAAFHMATGRFTPQPMMFWDVWFGLGAALFVLTLGRFRRLSLVGGKPQTTL